ncbi:MAG TPA: Grx4 family monothiol glutaredoxin [Candidatus Nanoarchaeia archaeon]|nr:Grx4 family monothiol glutaredoxin [Candidatus Nanoarchaeia archaeon]
MDAKLKKRIEGLVKSKKVFLFMKGTPDEPQCGFSAQVVEILRTHDAEFGSFNILEDEELRQAVKEFSNWPTFPQLYINGKLIGGCDIVTEMDEKGELAPLLKK